MRHHHPLRGNFGMAVAALLLLTGTHDAAAQGVHRCSDAGGTVRWSDRPCNDGKLLVYGPTPDPASSRRTTSTATAPRMPDVSPHQGFLGVDCAELAEAVRTARGRGVGSDGVDALRREYRGRCAEDDAMARRKYQLSLRAEQQRRADVRDSLQQAQAEEQRQAEACGQMKRNLASRRARTDLTPGEQADLQRFEATYQERCRR